MKKTPTDILAKTGLRKTPFRLQVLELFLEKEEALSSHQLEVQLAEVDRVTLYRTLRTFEQKGIIHQAIDGTQSPKYALCTDGCSAHQHHDSHAHFHCVSCGKTFCLDESPQPAFSVPPGFRIQASHLVLQGTCPDCKGVS